MTTAAAAASSATGPAHALGSRRHHAVSEAAATSTRLEIGHQPKPAVNSRNSCMRRMRSEPTIDPARDIETPLVECQAEHAAAEPLDRLDGRANHRTTG